jgi:hypothetical protein
MDIFQILACDPESLAECREIGEDIAWAHLRRDSRRATLGATGGD